MLTRNMFKTLLDIQYEKGHLDYDDLPVIIQKSIRDKYKNKKLALSRCDMNIYYKGLTNIGLTSYILCKN